MIDPPRLLDDDNQSFGARLLRSAERDRPSPRATRHAMKVAASVGSIAAFGAASAAAAPSAVLVKGVVTWLLAGGLAGAVVSVSAHQLAGRPAERASPAPAVRTAQSSMPQAPSREAARASTLRAAGLSAPSPAPVRATEPAPARGKLATLPSAAAPKPSAREAGLAPAPWGLPEALSGGASESSLSASTESPGFSDEVILIDRARQGLSAGDASSALSWLGRYESAFPRGHFLPESLALRVEALSAAGQAKGARQAAERFLSGYPDHPLSARVRAALARVPSDAGR